MSKNKFVFVVCGAREHIDTLHFSMQYLQQHSVNDIIVVTDSSRNEIPVEHSNVVDIETPKEFNHHQASIYLKVGLNKFLPKGFSYCYLDTDVIALTNECDEIFNYKKGPITFAADHCPMPEFSPYAVKCGCAEENQKQKQELESLIVKYDPALNGDPVAVKKKEETLAKFEAIKKNWFRNLSVKLRFNLARKQFVLDEDTIYDRATGIWHDRNGRNIFVTPNMEEEVMKHSIYRWDAEQKIWLDQYGKNVYSLKCDHLKEYIGDLWRINVADKNFRHWNGGVFLFDDDSEEFLNTWFDKTMQIFKLPQWRTRDQGTLIATVWQLNLQDNPVLPAKFNFIADHDNQRLKMDKEGNFSLDDFTTSIRPVFIHIFHSFGKTGWPVWDYVYKLKPQKN
ncbi:MAG: hypothetical protein JWO06_1002 [Bacteroidota bacterium]|nr:hypothetical protein [Bacteroidota bacterium]